MTALPIKTSLYEDHTKAIGLLAVSYESRESAEMAQAKLAAYTEAVAGLPQWCVEQAVRNFIQGRVERKNPEFRPTPEALAREARKMLDEEVSRQESEKIRQRLARGSAAPSCRPGFSPYEKRMERITEEMRDRAVLARNISHIEWRSRHGEYPAGATWLASTGNVYAPEVK